MTVTIDQISSPKWWDENAPAGATHCHYKPSGKTHLWYKITGSDSGQFKFMLSTDIGWNDGSGRPVEENELIPRPIDTPWQGPQDGLPPIGYTQDDCALVHLDESDKFTVVAHHHGHAIVAFGPDEDGGMVMSTAARESEFRPLKTERDKAAYELARDLGDICPMPEVVNKVIDLGYRKQMSRAEAFRVLMKAVPGYEQGIDNILDALGYKEPSQ